MGAMNELENDQEKTPTKQRILESAIHLFAKKGYTETTVRELAALVGVKEASIYNHFSSKNSILEHILEEYSRITIESFISDNLSSLSGNPTADDILSCMTLFFPKGKEEYYLEELYVILQEQHRNPVVRKFVSEQFILRNEQAVRTIVAKLKELHVLRADTDADFWAKMHSSLLYTFSSRRLLGIGDNWPGYYGMNMVDLMRSIYGMMLDTCGVEKVK